MNNKLAIPLFLFNDQTAERIENTHKLPEVQFLKECEAVLGFELIKIPTPNGRDYVFISEPSPITST